MQALAERLGDALTGKVLEGVEPLGFSALKTVVPAPESLIGRPVERVHRRAKYVLLDFGDSGRIMIHLSQAGRLDLEDPPKKTRAKGSVVRLRFADAPAVLVREYGT
jgi:formamidopyrimidine-DNA glycosylase